MRNASGEFRFVVNEFQAQYRTHCRCCWCNASYTTSVLPAPRVTAQLLAPFGENSFRLRREPGSPSARPRPTRRQGSERQRCAESKKRSHRKSFVASATQHQGAEIRPATGVHECPNPRFRCVARGAAADGTAFGHRGSWSNRSIVRVRHQAVGQGVIDARAVEASASTAPHSGFPPSHENGQRFRKRVSRETLNAATLHRCAGRDPAQPCGRERLHGDNRPSDWCLAPVPGEATPSNSQAAGGPSRHRG